MFEESQSSICRPLSINIFLADLLLMLWDIDITNFADDNTPYTFAKIDDIRESLEQTSMYLFK